MARTKQTCRVPPHLREQHLASMRQLMNSKRRELALFGPKPVKHPEPAVVTDSETEDILAKAKKIDAVRAKKRKRDEEREERKKPAVVDLTLE